MELLILSWLVLHTILFTPLTTLARQYVLNISMEQLSPDLELFAKVWQLISLHTSRQHTIEQLRLGDLF